MADYYEIIEAFLNASLPESDELEVGVNISQFPEIKIIFDGYGYDEGTGENSDTNFESYVVFVHKDALSNGFIFPEHEITAWAIASRPDEEVCINASLDKAEDFWDMNSLEDCIQSSNITAPEIETILQELYTKYFE